MATEDTGKSPGVNRKAPATSGPAFHIFATAGWKKGAWFEARCARTSPWGRPAPACSTCRYPRGCARTSPWGRLAPTVLILRCSAAGA